MDRSKAKESSWWERATEDGSVWHYVQLTAERAEPIAGVKTCACGRYRVAELTVTPASATWEQTRAPADAPCLEKARADEARRWPREGPRS